MDTIFTAYTSIEGITNFINITFAFTFVLSVLLVLFDRFFP